MAVEKTDKVRGPLGKTKVAKIVSDSETLDATYHRLFGTRDGKLVLAELLNRFYDCPMDGVDINREAGRRDVLHFIKKRVTL